jgi:hypothetical protein
MNEFHIAAQAIRSFVAAQRRIRSFVDGRAADHQH